MRTEKENLTLEKDENGELIQPWAWLIDAKIQIVDYDENGRITNIGILLNDPAVGMFDKPIINWIGVSIKQSYEQEFFIH